MPIVDALPDDDTEAPQAPVIADAGTPTQPDTSPPGGATVDSIPDESNAPDNNISVLYPDNNRVVSAPPALSASEIQYHDAQQNQGASPRDSVGYTAPLPAMDTWDQIGKWFNMPISAASHSMAQLEMNVPKSAAYLLRGHALTDGSDYEKGLADKIDSFSNNVDAGLEKDVKFYHDKMGFGFDLVGGVANIPSFLAAGPAVVATMVGGSAEDTDEQARKAGKSDTSAFLIGGGVGAINGAMQKLYLGRLSYAVQNEARPLVSKLISAGTNAVVTGTTGQLAQEGILQATGVSNKTASQVATDVAKTDLMFGVGEGTAHIAEHVTAPPQTEASPNVHPTDPDQFPGGVRYTDTDPTSEGFKVAKNIDAQNGVDLQPRAKADGTVQNPDGTTSLNVKLPGEETSPEPTAPATINTASDIMHAAATEQITPDVAKSALEAIGHPDPEGTMALLPEVKQIVSDKEDELIQQDYQKANDNPDLIKNTLMALEAAHEGDTLTLRELIEKEGGQVPPELKDVFDEIDAQKTVLKAKQDAAQAKESQVEDVDPTIVKARAKKLNDDLAIHDQRIEDQLTRISDLNKAGRPQKAAENKLEKMLNDRETMADELARLETADNKSVAESKSGKKVSEKDAVVKETLSKDVAVKGEDIAKAARDKARSRVEALIRGIRSGKSYGREETRAVQKAVIKIVNDFIKNSDHLDNSEKAKFLTPLKNMNTFDKLQKNLPLLQSMLRNAEGKAEGKAARNTVTSELSDIKPKTVNGKKKGKFTPEIQDHLSTLSKYNKMSQEDAANELASRLSGNADFTSEQKMENKLLAAVASGAKTAPSEWRDLVDHIQNVKADGKTIRQLGKDIAAKTAETTRAQVLENIPKVDELHDQSTFNNFLKGTANVGRWFINDWHAFVDKITGNNQAAKDALNVTEQYRNQKAGLQYSLPKLDEMVRQARGEADSGERRRQQYKDLRRRYISDPDTKEPIQFINANGKKVKLKYSVAEARSFAHDLLQGQGETYLHTEGNAYTRPMMEAITDLLSHKDIAQVHAQIDFLQQNLPRINEVYGPMNGVNLKSPENYFPIQRATDLVPKDPQQMINPFLDDTRPTVSPSSLKERTNSIKAIRQRADTNVLMKHVQQSEKYIAFAEKLQDIQRVFNDPELTRAMDEKYGTGFRKFLNAHLESFANDGIKDYTPLNRALNKLYANYAFAKIAIKPLLGLKHFSLIAAFPAEMPTADFMKGLADFSAHPKAAIENLMTSPVMKARYGSYDSSLETKMIVDQSHQYSTWLGRQMNHPNFINFANSLGQLGHQAATMIGGHAYYKYLTDSQGMTHDDAMRKVENLTNESQQSGDADRLSLYQKNQFGRMLGIFTSAPMGLFRMEQRIIKDFGNEWSSAESAGDKTAATYKMGRRLAIVHVGAALMYQAISNAFGSDKEAQQELKARATMGPLEGLPIIGNLIQSMTNAFYHTQESQYDAKMPGMLGAAQKSYEDANAMFKKLHSIFDDNSKHGPEAMDDFATWIDVLKAAKGTAQDAADFLGVPEYATKNIPQTIQDIRDGDVKSGVLDAAGYPKTTVHEGEPKKSKSSSKGLKPITDL